MKEIGRILLAVVLFSATQLSGQAWTPVGNGLDMPNGNFDSYPKGIEANGNQYVAYNDSNQIRVAKWNGLNWTHFPDLTISSSIDLKVNDLEVLSNEDIYLSLNTKADSGAIYQFTGGSWSKVANSDFDGSVIDLLYDAVNTRLYLGGKFSNTTVSNIGFYENGTFTDLPAVYNSNFDTVVSLSFVNNELVATGLFEERQPDTIPARVLRSGNWEKLADNKVGFSTFLGYGLKVFNESGKTYLFTTQSVFNPNIALYEIVADSIYFRDSLTYSATGVLSGLSFAETNSNGTFMSSRNLGVIRALNGSLNLLGNYPASVSSISALQNQLFYYAYDTAYNIQLYPINNYAYSTTTNFARVSGKAFLDQNSNCSYDGNETLVPFGLLGLTQGASTTNFSSNQQGDFSVLVPAGTYTFSAPTSLSRNYLQLSASCTLPTSISLSANQHFQQNIALEHDGSIDALVDVESYTGQATYGFTENYKVAIQNPGVAVSGLITVELIIPSTISFVSSVPQSTSVNGNKHTFTFSSLALLEEKNIQLQLKTDTAGNNLGDTLCLFAQINGITGDVNLQNNYDTLCLEVRGAYDPNDKTPNATQIRPTTNRIDYRIRFQNTGNSPAVKVTVVDTLDLTLPITAIIMNSASHPYSISVQNNILIWEFDNIMLPDSATDQLGSQGYIRFSAGLNPLLGLDDSIFNDAEIYFDYQKPIHTNTAKTVIVNNVSIVENELEQLMEVYPNPAKEKLFIKWKGDKTETFWLMDAQGKQVMRFEIENILPYELSVQQLPVGVYFIQSPYSTYKLLVQ